MQIKFNYNDGGRAAAGYRGNVGDCVVRAIAIAAQLPYQEVYDSLAEGTAQERQTKHRGSSGKLTAQNGIHTNRKWFKEYMAELGWKWTPTIGIGTGCKVHLSKDELPIGRLIVRVSKHYTAVIDGVINDTHDPSRSGSRCVYGYWSRGLH